MNDWKPGAEKVVRARRVRKGDMLISSVSHTRYEFVRADGDEAWVRSTVGAEYVGVNYVAVQSIFTHADGSPIDWEASE